MSSSSNRFALTDGDGLFHVVVAANGHSPPINSFVDSELARLGSGTLYEDETGRQISVLFEVVGCNLRQALKLLRD